MKQRIEEREKPEDRLSGNRSSSVTFCKILCVCVSTLDVFITSGRAWGRNNAPHTARGTVLSIRSCELLRREASAWTNQGLAHISVEKKSACECAAVAGGTICANLRKGACGVIDLGNSSVGAYRRV